ncbi:hypothetical protein F383_37148 [Gossypium arboreum]|uniref:Uncharacterized protein n=1 Tax=Gossypium arboreum TaxID=29729 RepID=A0A0B0M8P4_GOSAR|nr:hypothetical protein F383_37499 [Gossypium arboreum]KHG09890.1 hypothetical protein F383_37148 [Gossypium arboreum]
MVTEPYLNCMNFKDTSDMSLGLSFWWRYCMCCELTIVRMSLPIYQLVIRAYCPSTQAELTDHSLKERK